MLESVSIFFFMNDAGKAPMDFAHLNSYSVCIICLLSHKIVTESGECFEQIE